MSTIPLPPDNYGRPEPPLPPRRNWTRLAVWILAATATLVVIASIGIVALLHTDAFHQSVLRIARKKLYEATGVELRIRDFSLHLSGLSPSIDMYDVMIDGAGPYQTSPLLQVDHLSAGVQIVSLMSRKWYLKDVVIDHPIVLIFVGEDGTTNLPQTKNGGQSTSLFDLGVRHVMLEQGEVYYNDQKSSLDADLHDLEFQSSFEAGAERYSGGFRYKDGRIRFQNLKPMVHSLQAEFEATPDTFTLKRSTVSSGASQFSVSGTLNDYMHPKVSATYQTSLDMGELRQILKDATLPVGVVKLAGSAKYEGDPTKPAAKSVALDGNVTSNVLEIHTTEINTLVRDLSAQYTLENGDAEIRNLRAQILGGGVDGSVKIEDVTGAQRTELHAAVHNISLASLQSLLHAKAAQDLKVTGTANAKVDANWKKSFDKLVAHTDAEFNGTVTGHTGSTASQSSPLTEEGKVTATYSAATQKISVEQSYIRLPQTTINVNGTVSKTAALQVQVQSRDLSEIEMVARTFGAVPQPLGLGGNATFNGTVRGSTTNPLIHGQLSAASLKVRGTEWSSLRTGIDASPARVALRNGELVPASNRGRMTFNINVGLDQWKFNDSSPFQIDANASQLNIAELKNLVGTETPVTGTVSANISLHGSELNPVGGGTIALTQATIADEPLQSASIDFQGTGDELRARLGFRMPAGTAQASVTYFPKRKAYDGQLNSAGFRIDQIRTLGAHNVNLTGTLNLSAKGSGTLDNPGLQFSAQIPQLQIERERVNGITLQVDIGNRVANVSIDSQSASLNTFVRGHGRINLTGAFETDASLDTAAISLQPLFALYLPTPANNLMGQTELHATIHGPLKDKTQLEAHVTIPSLTLTLNNDVQLMAAQPVRVDYSHGVLNLQRTAIRGTGTDLQLQGTVPLTSTAPMTLVAEGMVDLSLGQLLDPDITSSGQIQFNIDGTGRRSNPEVQGQIKIVNASFASGGVPLGLENGNGVLVLTNNKLDIQQFNGNVSGGTLTATGGITYRPSLQFNVALNGRGLRTLFPDGVREGIDTNLSFVGSPDSATLRGQVRLTDVSFSPTFDFNDILGAAGGATGTLATPSGLIAQNLHMDINVISASDVNLASSQLNLQGTANLRVSGTAAEPSVVGRVNLTGGDLIFRGNRYILQPGTLDFVNPYQISPRVNLALDTTIQEYDVHMLFRGTLDRLRTTFTSEPPLPQSDIINLLVFGKAEEAQTANPTPLNLGAESRIASEVGSKLTSRVEKVAGISQLSVDPVLSAGNGQNPGARVTVQQRVTGNVFVTFATDATSTQSQVIKLEYQATPRVSVSGVRDQNGGFAFDIRIKKTW